VRSSYPAQRRQERARRHGAIAPPIVLFSFVAFFCESGFWAARAACVAAHPAKPLRVAHRRWAGEFFALVYREPPLPDARAKFTPRKRRAPPKNSYYPSPGAPSTTTTAAPRGRIS
jgi:hypothetical protein